MRIICLVKYVPNAAGAQFDAKKDRINREKARLILSPDDTNALAWALKKKKENPGTYVEVVSMGPIKIENDLKEVLRLGVDKAVLINDKSFVGSDSYATSLIISKYLESTEFDIILTGTHTLDGGTGHVGPQIAERLNINQYSNIVEISEVNSNESIIKVNQDNKLINIGMKNPSILSVTSQMRERLGFVRYENIDKDVDNQFILVTNETLEVPSENIGRKGSPTKVRRNILIKEKKVPQQIVDISDEGIDTVIHYLKEKGYYNV
ncbi:electron transfer flavoprotein subunit beta/FixA family protein [Vagococcus fluvialis]|uniref:electron transfer flavoprotein subunit beta/FixA family protein n=1 Tax=Vagococcus fluvialis TaxID=2738 RepID=UPI001D0B7255|nr:electron transfer flavoprotein subunit beta/FixA family protein [Vagococcus fluvialis]UDM80376.1 electron transfer flavoprotein subunit beta/FixA family protein [Vagococcus fluvialis]